MKDHCILQTESLTKTYSGGDHSLTVLNRITFSVDAGTSCAIIGPSGSGKTTLLGLCAGLDQPTSGEVRLKGGVLGRMSEDELAAVRNRHVGFIFQSFQLVPTLTAIENVMVPLELRGVRFRKAYQQALDLLETTGLKDRIHHYPSQLSGGEQQRVGIARAFINRPDILFADEPTGNLDSRTGRNIETVLFDLNRRLGTTLIIVTHDIELAMQCERVIRLKSGEIENDELTAVHHHEGSEQTAPGL